MARNDLTKRLPLKAKAIAIGHWHPEAMECHASVIREFRSLRDVPRPLEGFWIVTEACLV
jgi:hypothetical protein